MVLFSFRSQGFIAVTLFNTLVKLRTCAVYAAWQPSDIQTIYAKNSAIADSLADSLTACKVRARSDIRYRGLHRVSGTPL